MTFQRVSREKPIEVKVPIWPTRPEVPMPAPAAMFVILKPRVATGPRIAAAIVGGARIQGFLIMFGTWSIEVPMP